MLVCGIKLTAANQWWIFQNLVQNAWLPNMELLLMVQLWQWKTPSLCWDAVCPSTALLLKIQTSLESSRQTLGLLVSPSPRFRHTLRGILTIIWLLQLDPRWMANMIGPLFQMKDKKLCMSWHATSQSLSSMRKKCWSCVRIWGSQPTTSSLSNPTKRIATTVSKTLWWLPCLPCQTPGHRLWQN